jgi:uncharacterized membrane protein
LETQVRPAQRIAFLAYALVAGAFGLLLTFIPANFGSMLGETFLEPFTWRLVGASITSLAVTSVLAYRQRIWDRVKIVAQLNIISSTLLVIVEVYGMVFEGVSASDWMNVAILGAFAVAFGVLYRRE